MTGGVIPRLVIMSELRQMGVPITLDCERNLIFNLNVIEKCVDRFGAMDDILNAADIKTVKWFVMQMVNEDAAIWNKDHPDQPKTFLDEDGVARYVIGMNGFLDLQKKVREAMILGLPADQVEEVEVLEKNLMTAQATNGKMSQLLRRFLKK